MCKCSSFALERDTATTRLNRSRGRREKSTSKFASIFMNLVEDASRSSGLKISTITDQIATNGGLSKTKDRKRFTVDVAAI